MGPPLASAGPSAAPSGAHRLSRVRTLVYDPPPKPVEELLERRRRLGQDVMDEVWEGVLHMNPARSGWHLDVQQQLAVLLGPLARGAGLFAGVGIFNLGASANDYRVPDGGIFRDRPAGVWHPTAALVIEIVSPGDESREKLGFYAAHGVDEVLIVNPRGPSVDWLALREGAYRPVRRSGLIDLGAAELAERLDWPPSAAD